MDSYDFNAQETIKIAGISWSQHFDAYLKKEPGSIKLNDCEKLKTSRWMPAKLVQIYHNNDIIT